MIDKMKTYTFLGLLIIIASSLGCNHTNTSNTEAVALDQDELNRPISPCKNIDGKYLRAFEEAQKSFQNDKIIPDKFRKIENYTISFREDDSNLLVDYLAKMTAEEKKQERVGGGTSLGISCTYILNKRTYQVVSRVYPK